MWAAICIPVPAPTGFYRIARATSSAGGIFFLPPHLHLHKLLNCFLNTPSHTGSSRIFSAVAQSLDRKGRTFIRCTIYFCCSSYFINLRKLREYSQGYFPPNLFCLLRPAHLSIAFLLFCSYPILLVYSGILTQNWKFINYSILLFMKSNFCIDDLILVKGNFVQTRSR